jgi:raffinose/stachyose/melibiose transport system substrate-binding protein
VEAFLDTVIPANVSTVTYDGLQGLFTGDVTPQAFTADIQAAWETAKAKGEIMDPGGVVKP